MIKKILIFNLFGNDHIEEGDDYSFKAGEDHYCYYRTRGWHQVIASLMEGIISLSDITVFSTTELNYGYKVLLKNAKRKKHTTALNYTYYSHILDEDSYIAECEDLAEECDVIIIMEGEYDGPTTYFKNKKGEIIKHLHHYMLVNHRDKIVFIEAGDLKKDYYEGKIKYTHHPESQPPYYQVYFRREKDLDEMRYNDNIASLPFSAEERYFTGSKNFERIWANKKLDMVSLFRPKNNSRQLTKNILVENFKNNNKCIVDYLSLSHTIHDVSPKPGFARVHKEESEAFLQARISVDGEPGHGCYYTDRMFKSLAAGCCLFIPTPAYNVDFPNGFKDGVDVIIYDKENLNDLIEKIKYYLDNKEELKIIAKNGFNKLIKYHISKVRAKEFIATCERYME